MRLSDGLKEFHQNFDDGSSVTAWFAEAEDCFTWSAVLNGTYQAVNTLGTTSPYRIKTVAKKRYLAIEEVLEWVALTKIEMSQKRHQTSPTGDVVPYISHSRPVSTNAQIEAKMLKLGLVTVNSERHGGCSA